MPMSLVSGVSHVTIGGTEFAVDDGPCKFEMATINREPVMGKNGRIFIKETPQPAKVTFSVLVPSDVDVSTFNSQTSSNVVVHLANGSVLNAAGFATMGTVEYDSNEGKVALEWFGPKITVTLGA